MRVHRLKLTDFKGVRECEVTFAERGVTIIEGDNEIGKTSLVEALDLLLTTRDDSKTRNVRDAKPVDRDVGTEVEAEISAGPYCFVYRKRWHKQRLTELRVLSPSPEQLTGRDAHDRVELLLGETLDRGLWDALRVTQGTELAQGQFGDCESLGRALDAAAGGDVGGDADDTLWERIVAERGRYVTPTGRPNSERVARAERLREVTAHVDDLEAQLAALDRDAEEVARLTSKLADLADGLERARSNEEALDARARQVEHQRGRVRELTARAEAAAAAHERQLAVQAARREQIDRLADLRNKVAALDTQRDQLLPATEAAQRRHDDLDQRLADARAAVADADEALRSATADAEHLRQLIELDQLRERHERVVTAQQTLDDAEAALEATTVDQAAVARIDEAHLAVERARAVLDAGAARIDATALSRVELTVDGDVVSLDAGATHGITVSDSVTVDVPGVVGFVVRAGSDARSLGATLATAEQRLANELAAVDVADVAAARRALAERADAERAVDDARRTIRQDLRDLTPEVLASKVVRLSERVAAFRDARADTPPLPVDLDTAEALAAQLDDDLGALRRSLASLEAEQKETTAADEQARTSLAALDAERRVRAGEADELAESLEVARADEPDAELDARVDDAAAVLASATAELRSAEEDLAAADPDSVDDLLDNARATLRRADADHAALQQDRRDLLVRLEVRGDEGVAEQRDSARTELVRLQAEHDRIEARAAAAELLYETFQKRRDEARSRYLAPFRERIERLGRLVYGATFSVELGDDLAIERRTLDGVTVGYDQLSVGAREQLGILSRLACASIVSADGGAPVVVDDALGWSDPSRVERMGAALAVAGRECQVIVLTCTPGRYSGVGDATVVRLSN